MRNLNFYSPLVFCNIVIGIAILDTGIVLVDDADGVAEMGVLVNVEREDNLYRRIVILPCRSRSILEI